MSLYLAARYYTYALSMAGLCYFEDTLGELFERVHVTLAQAKHQDECQLQRFNRRNCHHRRKENRKVIRAVDVNLYHHSNMKVSSSLASAGQPAEELSKTSTSSTDTRRLGCGCDLTAGQLRTQWRTSEQKKFDKGDKRTYLHFDKRFKEIADAAVQDIWSASTMTTHAFLPLVQTTITERKFKKVKKLAGENPIVEKLRPISYASHFDALALAWYAHMLNHCYNHVVTKLDTDDAAIAYRDNKPRKNNVAFAKEVFDFIKQRDSDMVVMCFDITGFFDHLDHKILKRMWKLVLSVVSGNDLQALPPDHYGVYKNMTRFSFVDRDEIYKRFGITVKDLKGHEIICSAAELREKAKDLITPNTKPFGIPQGTPISAILSNLYMIEFDKRLLESISSVGGLYRRYSDDILVAVPKEHAKAMTDAVKKEVGNMNLEMQDEKTDTVFFTRDGDTLRCIDADGGAAKLVYLGIEYDGVDTDIKGKSLARYQRQKLQAIKTALYKARKNKRPLRKTGLLRKYSHSSKRTFVEYMRKSAAALGSKRILAKTTKKSTTDKLARDIQKLQKKVRRPRKRTRFLKK